MPDKLTDQERDLIRAAVAAGRVTMCPPRTFSPPVDESWMAIAARSRARKARLAAAVAAPEASPKARTASNIARGEVTRAAVRGLVDGGASVEEICTALNKSKTHVQRLIREMKR